MLLSGTLLLCAAIVFLFFWIDRSNSKRLDGPPGPKPWPVLGNLPLLVSLKSMSRGFFELSQKYGPVMSLWVGPQRFVIISSPEMAQEVLRTQDHATASRQVGIPMINYLTRYKDIATSPYNNSWRQQRRLGLLHIASPRQIEAWAAVRRAEVQRMVEGMAAAAESGEGRRGLVVRPLLFAATLNNIMMVCAGRRYPYPVITDEAQVTHEAQWGYAFTLLPSSAFALPQTKAEAEAEAEGGKGGDCDGDAASDTDLSTALEREGQYVEGLIERTLSLMSTLPLINFIPFLAPIDPWQSLQRAQRLGGELEAYFGGLIRMRREELRQQRERQQQQQQEVGGRGAEPQTVPPSATAAATNGKLNGEADSDSHAPVDPGLEAVRKFLRSSVAPSKSTFLDLLLSLEGEDGEEGGVSEEEMYLLLFDMVSGGSDTTSKTVEWALSELMRHPSVLSRLRGELEAYHTGTGPAVDDVVKLPYLQGVMKETFRMHPFLPLLLPHLTTEPINLAGYSLQAGSVLQVNAWGIQNDPKVWKDPHVFDPSRFTEPGECIDVQGFDFRILPFSSGRRKCLGSNLAVDMTARLIAAIVHNFDMSLPEGCDSVDMREVSGLSTPKLVPLKLVLKRRA